MSRLLVILLAALALVPLVPASDLPVARGADPDDLPKGAFAGRTAAARPKFVKHYGGSDDSEKAVALGLEWLAKQQKKDGSWVFDQGTYKDETAAATGFAVLAFLGAGETHKPPKEKEQRKYTKVVAAGLGYMTKNCPLNGATAGRLSAQMYAQGVGALALAEAYAMTKDPALKPVVLAAVNYIQKAQGANGSWGYSTGTSGDISITGWQVQALFTARLAGLAVDDKVVKKAVKFLDLASAGETKAKYGYTDNAGAAPGTALTASGLWSRCCIDGWGPDTPGFKDGAAGLLKNPPAPNRLNLYHLYFATLVARAADDDTWKTWNEGPKQADDSRKGGMRDVLVGAQVKKNGADLGSWDPDAAYIGSSCGRMGTTALCVINLEAYYRYGPIEIKDDKKK